MALFVLIALIVALVWYVKVYNSPNAKAVRAICRGKSPEQKKVIEYFCKEGCMTKTITDQEYLSMVYTRRDAENFRQKALKKLGVDEEEVIEISPAKFEGFVFGNAYAKKRATGNWVSSAYQIAWLFFSSEAIYIYQYTFNMDDDRKREHTYQFFYKDITSFSTSTLTEQAHGLDNNRFEVDTDKFKIIVPGDQILVSMDGISDSDDIIQAMKQKLHEKKQ